MSDLYEDDVIAWAQRQARLLRGGHWSQLDIDNIAEEIEDVGKSEQRELQSRLRVLMSHLLKWKYQPQRRGRSWRHTIILQRTAIVNELTRHPSLRHLLGRTDLLAGAYRHARSAAYLETGLSGLPDDLPWIVEQLLSADFLPE